MSRGAERAGWGAEYVMIRLHPSPDQDAPVIAGATERLGTGELTLESGDGSRRLLGSRPGTGFKMQVGRDFGNPAGPA